MNKDDFYWMRYSVDIMKKTSGLGLHVAAVLTSYDNELLCYGASGYTENDSWCSMLLKKINELNITNAKSIYLTTNTFSKYNGFELNTVLKRVCIKNVYLGLPDPDLYYYIENDPVFAENKPYRFTTELQREIIAFNNRFYYESKQCIKNSPYYSANRIGNLVAEQLGLRGIFLTKEELDNNKQKFALSSLISAKYGKDDSESSRLVNNVIAEAFNSKYGSYNYVEDTRSLETEWKNSFMFVYSMSTSKPMEKQKVLNVGVGSGNEAYELFRDHIDVTFVDISKTGLSNVKKKLPLSDTIITSADDLGMIADESFELYISLRTYNSSYFDIQASVREAYRVLKPEAEILISVANGFLSKEQQSIIPGLIIPGTEFVDIYRGIDIANLIYKELMNAGCKEIKITPSNTEIYLSAKKMAKQQLSVMKYSVNNAFCKG